MAENIRYVAKVPPDNWLLVQMEGGLRQSLPYGLKVRVTKSQSQRDYFEILEGVHKGKKASVTQRGSYLTTNISHLPGAEVKFDRVKQALWYDGKGPYSAFSGAFDRYTQVSPGTYDLQIPDAPHSATRAAYSAYAQHHKTWFLIGTSGSRYLHVGEISEGCVTVRAFVSHPGSTQPNGFSDLPELAKRYPGAIGMPYPDAMPPTLKWDDLYAYLILRRASDQRVGKLKVV